ncbi:MAG: hypothetical protein R3D34_08390 [Nitratireductor sp.]
MDFTLAFAPLLPLPVIIVIGAITAALALYGLSRGIRGSWIRLFAFAVMTLALLNPALLFEEREPLKSVVAIVTDKSGSQKLDGREQQTEEIRAALVERLQKFDMFDIRQAEARDQVSAATDVSTALFGTLQKTLQDVPPEQIAGSILITDGQVHDIPQSLAGLGIKAPVHALVTGREGERDRRIVVTSAPRYGVVGEDFEINYRVIDHGIEPGAPVSVIVSIDGEPVATESVQPGEERNFIATIPHGGKNIIELRAAPAGNEITEVNNRAFVTLNGIRQNLRVLLVSGEPHSGERTWRNLLKSDPSVDLVHFTILRPPEKQDGTPINQLSLIAFPTRELFVQKIDEFDLIIFDRYKRRNVLPLLYFDNIVRYVRDGGALLIAGGPEFGESPTLSIAGPLRELLPAAPTGRTLEGPFKPMVSQTGLRHPVTRGLDGWNEKDPKWGHWFRTIAADSVIGETVMTGKDDAPLVVLNHFGEGRVALYLSDQAWLWARGFDGGGPYVQLLRRTAHWLMKEPELDEERLTADAEGQKLVITRQTLGDEAGEARITGPSGNSFSLPFKQQGPGLWQAEAEVPDYGLYTAVDGSLRALTHVGPPNPREYAEVVSTTQSLASALEAGRGSAIRASAASMPRIVPVRVGAPASGDGWIGLENTRASVLTGINRVPLFSGLLGLAILLLAMASMWAREGSRP